MFHFPTFPPHALCVQARVTPHDWCGVPPFGHPRINARLAAPRGLTQPPTSFIGSWCPGIHRVPLTTWPHKIPTPSPPEGNDEAGLQELFKQKVRRCSRPLCSSQPPTGGHPTRPARPRPPQETNGTRPGQPRTRQQPPPEEHTPKGTPRRQGPFPQDPTARLRPTHHHRPHSTPGHR
jgi:hypothetical protein